MTRDLQFQLTADAAERYDTYSLPLMSPFVATLAQRVRSGDNVLDLASGTGYTALAAAEQVGPSGQVMAVDVNQVMLDVAMRANRPFKAFKAPADALPFSDQEFDVVLCQQGLQFFPDLTAALAEVQRVLHPGGQFAATVWAAHDRIPYVGALIKATQDIMGAGAIEGASSAFGMDPERFKKAATAVGLVEITVEEVTADVHLPPLPGYAARYLTTLPFGAKIAEADPGAVTRIAWEITELLRDYRTSDGGADVPFVSLLLTARKGRRA